GALVPDDVRRFLFGHRGPFLTWAARRMRPETVSRVGVEGEDVASAARAGVVPRPAKPARPAWGRGGLRYTGGSGVSGKVCGVTGGASGMGGAGARRFARAGARVVVADRNAAGAEAVAREIDGFAVPVDVGDEASVDGMVARVLERHGALDVLWANAGIA